MLQCFKAVFQCFSSKVWNGGWPSGLRPSMPHGCIVEAVCQHGTYPAGPRHPQGVTMSCCCLHSLPLSLPSFSPRQRAEPPCHRELCHHHVRAQLHHSPLHLANRFAWSSSTSSSSSRSEPSIGEAALPFLRIGDLAGVLPCGRSPWPELSGHLLLPLVGALGSVGFWDAHRGGNLGPVATAGEVRRHALRRATMRIGELSPMVLPFV
jgi:hypothetical protein